MNRLDHNDDPDERGLLQAARAGDEWALGRLLAPHWRDLKLFCGLMLGDVDAADRAMAETILAARSEVEVIESAASVRMWIHRIAARVCCQTVGYGPIQNDQPPEAHDGAVLALGVNGADDP